jgi:hypothetical protein
VSDYSVGTGPVRLDMAQVRQRKRNIVGRFRNNRTPHRETTAGVDLLLGEARLSGLTILEVLLEVRPSGRLAFVQSVARTLANLAYAPPADAPPARRGAMESTAFSGPGWIPYVRELSTPPAVPRSASSVRRGARRHDLEEG